VNDSLKNTALKALKELIYGILQYAVFVVAIPLLMREVGLEAGLEPSWFTAYFAVVIALSILNAIVASSPVSIGFKVLRSLVIIYAFLIATNYGVVEVSMGDATASLDFSIIIYTIASFLAIYSAISSLDELYGTVEKFK
jgi:energy-coupling factor transporter transmembrane protein EcfT